MHTGVWLNAIELDDIICSLDGLCTCLILGSEMIVTSELYVCEQMLLSTAVNTDTNCI